MDSVIEEIKHKLDVVEVVGSYVKLQKAGANYRCLSPFNAEKTPSFFVSPAKQIWHDFSSGRGGDIFKFVMEIEGVEFPQALRLLAKKAGVELHDNPEWKKSRDEKEKIYEICDRASLLYEAYLFKSKSGKEALDYLLSRWLKEETIKNWRLGFAPDKWRALTEYLAEKKFTKNEIEKAGLAIRKTDGNFFDRFKMRIMYPLFDLNGQIAGFTGRVLRKEQELAGMAKYMNIPNTLVYDKSQMLYGLHKAKVNIVKNDFCILVEGQMDCLMSHQAGVENVVAVSGTALTPFHLNILKRYTKNLALAFDMDLGGNNASERGIKMALAEGFSVKAIIMKGGKDPAEIIANNADDWKEMVKNTQSILDFYFDVAFSRYDKNSIDGKKSIASMVLPVIKKISNRIEQVFWVGKLAHELNIKEEALADELKKLPENEESSFLPKPTNIPEAPASKTRRDKLEERIFSLVLTKSQVKDKIQSEDISEFSPKFCALVQSVKNDPQFDLEKIDDYELKTSLKDMVFQYELLGSADEEIKPEREFDICLMELRLINVKEKMSDVSWQIKQAEAAQDWPKAKELCEQFKELGNKIKHSI